MRDAILQRVSTRTFKKDHLPIKRIAKIESILKKYTEVKGPFGHSFEFTFSLNNDKDYDRTNNNNKHDSMLSCSLDRLIQKYNSRKIRT